MGRDGAKSTMTRWQRSLSENRWPVLLGAAALLWANLPILMGFAVQDSHHLFSGFFICQQDGFSYLAKMRQGAEGNWLFKLPYTTEPHQGALLYVFYLVAGKLSRVSGLEYILVFHLFRLLGSLVLLAVCAKFVTRFADTHRWRSLSWALILWGGGVDWLISMLDTRYVAFASIAPDAFVFTVLYGPPHIIIALVFLLWTLMRVSYLFEPAANGDRRRIALQVGAAGLGIALMRPEYVAILLSVTAAYWLVLCWRDRQLHLNRIGMVAVAALPAGIYAAYVFWVSRTDPAMSAWAAQNSFESPSLPNLLAGIGLLLLPTTLGIAGWPANRSLSHRPWWRNRDRLVLTAWLAAVPILLHIPLSLNRRLIGGAQIAMAIVAGYWIDRHLLPWLAARPRCRVGVAPILMSAAMLLVSYPLLFGASAASFVATRPASLFLSGDELVALKWLAEQNGQPVVLASETTGNRIPAFSNAIPVLGHPIETLAVEKRRMDVSRFFATGTDTAERSTILDEYHVDLIWWGENELRLGDFSPADEPGMKQVFNSASIEIWVRKLALE